MLESIRRMFRRASAHQESGPREIKEPAQEAPPTIEQQRGMVAKLIRDFERIISIKAHEIRASTNIALEATQDQGEKQRLQAKLARIEAFMAGETQRTLPTMNSEELLALTDWMIAVAADPVAELREKERGDEFEIRQQVQELLTGLSLDQKRKLVLQLFERHQVEIARTAAEDVVTLSQAESVSRVWEEKAPLKLRIMNASALVDGQWGKKLPYLSEDQLVDFVVMIATRFS